MKALFEILRYSRMFVSSQRRWQLAVNMLHCPCTPFWKVSLHTAELAEESDNRERAASEESGEP